MGRGRGRSCGDGCTGVWSPRCTLIMYYLLRDISPVAFDGSGPMPSFYWAEPRPLPDLSEYYRRRSYYDLKCSFPYIVAALFITTLGCGVGPLIARRVRVLSKRPFVGPWVATLALLLVAAIVSDLGGLMKLWSGPSMLLHSFQPDSSAALAKLVLPPSLLTGAASFFGTLLRAEWN